MALAGISRTRPGSVSHATFGLNDPVTYRHPGPLIQRALMVWIGLFGVVSFELYGQPHQVVGEEPADRDAFFAECIRRWLQFMNLA